MARRKPSQSKEVARWDEELARQADVAAAMEANAGGGQFFGLRSGLLTWNDAPLPENQMAVIIVDHVLENVFYEGAFDPDVPQSPTCFAFARDEKTMRPHEQVIASSNDQADFCHNCELNEFGSAETGRGKACRNVRRLAMIPAGTINRGEFELFDDPEHFETAEVGYMKLPVTSVKGFASFVKQVAGALRRPPHGIITKVRVVPDSRSQFKVVFEPIESVPDELLEVVMKRHEEVRNVIEFPYAVIEEEEAPPPRTARTKKPAAKAKAKAAATQPRRSNAKRRY